MSYGQFCPIAKAAEIVAEKWSIIIIREVLAGSETFNTLKKGIPLISPTLLSRRLLELEDAHLIKKVKTGIERPRFRYLPEKAAVELGPILMQLGDWGNKWIGANLEKQDYDPRLLMWDIRRNVDLSLFKTGDINVIQFEFGGVPRSIRYWWLVMEKDKVDVCVKNPGHEIQLYVKTHIKTMTEIWMGRIKLSSAKKDNEIHFEGALHDINLFPKWFKLNPFAYRK